MREGRNNPEMQQRALDNCNLLACVRVGSNAACIGLARGRDRNWLVQGVSNTPVRHCTFGMSATNFHDPSRVASAAG